MRYNSDFPIVFLKQYHLADSLEFQNNTFDLIYVLEGQLTISSNFHDHVTYTEGHITMLRSNVPHILTPDESNVFIHLGLSSEFMQKYSCPDYQIFCDSALEPNRNYVPIKNLITNIVSLHLDPYDAHQLTLFGLIFQLLDILKNNYSIHPLVTGNEGTKYSDRINRIVRYLNDNYRQPITLGTLAESMYLTPQYLSKFFKQHFGMNFVQYLNRIRIEHAMRDIQYTDKSVTDIAVLHGFPNISTFNRHFRERYGTSPREYRKSLSPAPTTTTEWRAENHEHLHPIAIENADTCSIVTEVSSKNSFCNNFTKMINIGYAKNLESDLFRERLLAAQRDLGFRYVRIEGLISNSMIPRLARNERYYFAGISDILTFLWNNHLIPFIELGKNSFDYISCSTSASTNRGYCNSERFHHMFRAFMEFAQSHCDPVWMKEWKFELWKMPQEPEGSYFDGFEKLQNIILDYLPDNRLGGPGYATTLSAEDFLHLLNEFKLRQLNPGFISVHFFHLQYSGNSSGPLDFSAAAREFHVQQKWMKELIRNILKKEVPLFITEFNSSIIPQTYINSSCFQAAFICKTLLEMHEDSDFIGYWMLEDSTAHESDQALFLTNEISLINKNGICTPAYHAYKMLTGLGNLLIEKGENYCITQKEDEHYQILTFNYSHFKNLDSMVKTIHHSILDTYTYFEQVPPLTMTFTLRGLSKGTYRITRHLLDRMHGSVMDIYLGGLVSSAIAEEQYMYKMQTPGRETLNYLKSTCIPEERVIFLDVESQLTVTINLSVHNVCFFDIVKEY